MTRVLQAARRQTTPKLVMLTTVVAFVAVAFSLTLRLRADLRAEILRREAESLRSMVALQEARAKDDFEALASVGLAGDADTWFPLLLETARLSDVIALRLFDAKGALRDALPVPVGAHVEPSDWTRVIAGESFARLHDHVVAASVRIG